MVIARTTLQYSIILGRRSTKLLKKCKNANLTAKIAVHDRHRDEYPSLSNQTISSITFAGIFTDSGSMINASMKYIRSSVSNKRVVAAVKHRHANTSRKSSR